MATGIGPEDFIVLLAAAAFIATTFGLCMAQRPRERQQFDPGFPGGFPSVLIRYGGGRTAFIPGVDVSLEYKVSLDFQEPQDGHAACRVIPRQTAELKFEIADYDEAVLARIHQ